MRASALLLGAVVVVIGAGAWWLCRGRGDATIDRRDEALAAREKPVEKPALAERAAPPTPEAQRTNAPLPTEPPKSAGSAPESYTKALAGVHGRILEADLKPVARLPVSLLEVKLDAIFTGSLRAFEEIPEDALEWEVASTTTDEQGRFSLGRAHARPIHLLCIDPGGARSTMRLVDQALDSGGDADLGDVVLPAFVTIVGRVTDESGAPLADARVRSLTDLPIPAEVLSSGVQDVRGDCALLGRLEQHDLVFEPPRWLERRIDQLPIPTARTDADGRFRLAGVEPGLATLFVDHPGKLGLVKGGVPTGRTGEHNVGTLALGEGRKFVGHLKAGATPLAGARVYVGAELPIPGNDKPALAHPAGPTAEDGRFELAGLPQSGGLFVAVQSPELETWRLFGPFEQDEATLELPATATLSVLLDDGAENPVQHGDLRLVVELPDPSMLVFASPPRPLGNRMREEPGGRYVIDALAVGKWCVLARAPGFGAATQSVELTAAGVEAKLSLPPARPLEVRVVDAATRAPIEWATVTVMSSTNGIMPHDLAWARTGPDGAATLEHVPLSDRGELVITARHPAHPARSSRLDSADPSAVVELALESGGTLVGRVSVAGEPPRKPMMLMLQSSGSSDASPEESLPRFAVTALDGGFKVTHLQAQKYSYTLMTRFLMDDPIKLVRRMFELEPEDQTSGSVEIEEGGTTELPIELKALIEDDSPRATVRGHVRVRGTTVAGAKISIFSHRGRRETKTDETGAFTLDDVRAGKAHLQVAQPSSDDSESRAHWTYFDELELAPGEQRVVELDFRTARVAVDVADQDGAPIRGASVRITRAFSGEDVSNNVNASGSTDEAGHLDLEVMAPARYDVVVEHDEQGRFATDLELADSTSITSVRATLSRGIPCAGRVEFEGKPPSGEWMFLMVQSAEDATDRADSQFDANVDKESGTFEVKWMRPGRYQATLWVNGDAGWLTEFTLPPGGDRDLVLRFHKRT